MRVGAPGPPAHGVQDAEQHGPDETPRKIVTTMQQVIEEVRLAGHDPTEGLVSVDFLDQYEIVEEVLGEGGVT